MTKKALKKLPFPTEICYLLGMCIIALGTVLMEHTGLGMIAMTAPAHILYLILHPIIPFFTFGLASFLFQGLLLLALALILRRFPPFYLFSFISAFFCAVLIDLFEHYVELACEAGGFWIFSHTSDSDLFLLLLGTTCYAFGVALLRRSYLAPEVYELFADEMSEEYHFSFSKVKTVYDCSSSALAILLSVVFLGTIDWDTIGWGTIICSILDGVLIGGFYDFLARIHRPLDLLPLRHFFHRDLEAGKEGKEG